MAYETVAPLAMVLLIGTSIRSPGRTNGAVRQDGKGAPPPGGNGHDVAPVRDVALALVVPPRGEESAVSPQANRVRAASVRERVDVAHGDGSDPVEVADLTLW